MRSHKPAHQPACPPAQGASTELGAATLLLVLGLVLLATLASAYGSRAVLAELLASQGLARAALARLQAQAAMATAEAALLRAAARAAGQELFSSPATSCPPERKDLKGPQWECNALPLSAGTNSDGGSDWRWTVTLARDLLESPHVWQVHASASAGRGLGGQAALRQSVFMPVLAPAPADSPTAALILNGCASPAPGSQWQVCPLSNTTACSGNATGPAVYSHHVPDSDQNGSIGAGERNACMAFGPASLPGGGGLDSPITLSSRSPCNRAAWRSVFGNTTPEQLRTWSQAQERQGLHSLSQPPRSIYWIDSPADWTQSLGSAAHPVLLVFSSLACAGRCPRLSADSRIWGTVYLDAGCDDEKMRGWQAGRVQGQLVVEAGLPQFTGSAQVWASAQARQAYALHWPEGMDAGRVQRVPGSRFEGSP